MITEANLQKKKITPNATHFRLEHFILLSQHKKKYHGIIELIFVYTYSMQSISGQDLPPRHSC